MESKVLLMLLFSLCYSDGAVEKHHCEKITIPMCIGIGYNMTVMPNLMGHSDQSAAAINVHEFSPLVEYGCAPHLKFFLCSLYAPMCSEELEQPIPACRPMCEDARRLCSPIMERFNFPWPESLDCTVLPVKGERTRLCMEAPDINDNSSSNYPVTGGPYQGIPFNDDLPAEEVTTLEANPCAFNPERWVYVEKTQKCAARCDVDVFYQETDKDFAKTWLGIWGVLCCASAVATVLTFCVDRARFKYPERPIIFLSMCYFVYSVAYIVRLVVGPEAISCDETNKGVTYRIQEGLESTGCTIVFLIQYYFYMASSIWWVILTLTWFLAAGMKWGYEAIAAHSSYFHLVAWAIPAVKTIVVLVMRRVDGDELTGMCYVGNQDSKALLGFVLIPLFCYFIIGTSFILAGFVYLFRIRKVMKIGGKNIEKLEKLMVRIGVFSVLYTVPATCVIATYFFQYINMEDWEHQAKYENDCVDDQCLLAESIPNVPVLVVKIFMLLVVGITSGMWIWSSKTVNSWQRFFNRRFHRKKQITLNYKVPIVPHSPPRYSPPRSKYTISQGSYIPAGYNTPV
uniref:Frizzled receptor 9,10-like protein n=1 Tax=Saccoglossus kowalevskii TaxID=10224 RepID=A0A2K9RCH3_SACKO|nr:frizzled receptor 9,10-like protein [Saccoglossus kowalevskii]